MIFLDSSALAQAYLEEDGTSTVLGVFKRMRGALFVSDFVALEVLTTLRAQYKYESRSLYQQVIAEFYRDFPSRFNIVEVDTVTRRGAMSLTTARRDTKARSMDVLHVACALELQASAVGGTPVIMATSDRELSELSRAVGLGTFDPRTEPLAALPRRR